MYFFDFFCCKQKKAYEMRISDCSSDVCSSDLDAGDARHRAALPHEHRVEPAAAALAPGDGAEFMSALAELLAGRVLEFGREGAEIGRASCRERVCQYV